MGKLRELSDKVSEFADSKGLANPIEVIDEALGGQTREESKARRAKSKPAPAPAPEPQKPVEKAKGGMIKSSASKRADGCAIRGKTRA
jgi:hypothetical protein